MTFKIHMKYIEKVEQDGKWVKLRLKNGLVLEGKANRWELNNPYITYHGGA